MVGRPRKSRSASASASASAEPASAGGKRSADDNQPEEAIETTKPPRKKVALQEDNVEPGPEPTDQQVARLELKIQELGAENERLKEQVKKLKAEQGGDEADAKQNPKKKATAKAQPKDKPTRVQPKRKSAKDQPKGKAAKV